VRACNPHRIHNRFGAGVRKPNALNRRNSINQHLSEVCLQRAWSWECQRAGRLGSDRFDDRRMGMTVN
jgi:hypothetical protein